MPAEYENQAWLDNWLRIKAKQEKKNFNNLDNVKEKLRLLCFTQQNLKGKVVIDDYPDLTQLNLSNNELEEVIIRNCPDLKLVSLAHNKLTKLVIENCPSVQEIYTHNNQLTEWNAPLEEMKNSNLRIISYSDNPLASEEKTRLDVLGLPDKIIESRVDGEAQTYLDTKYPLAERTSIEKLDISELGLQGNLNLAGFTNLKKLDCSDNDLTSLNLGHCENLKYLDISNNKITNLDVTKNKKLQEIHGNNSGLDKISLNGLTELFNLNLVSNNLIQLDLTGLTNLLHLNCGLNKLIKLELEDNNKLQNLLCYGNKIEKLNIKYLQDLENLYCYNC
jgi:Leucine-rich repeat (LRR) protein